MNASLKTAIAAFALAMIWTQPATAREIDLTPHWDETTALENPHKGWYHHFPDNHINKYAIKNDSDLLDFPGMDHLYIRLAWAYMEPNEGEYNWAVIDDIIDKWTAHGLGIAFRISCKETSVDRIEQQFATPKWVMEAGAKGGHYRSGKAVGEDGPWEPVFDDPIYLEKLDNFLAAFAARYDGKPWLRHIDIGSIGDWGEGHTHSGSRKSYDYAQRKTHIDLHVNHFQKSQIVISDDFVYSVSDLAGREKLHRYVVDNGISYRDDSILVDWYVETLAGRDSVRSPEMFEAVWRTRPNVLELEHYSSVKRMGNWTPTPGSSLDKAAKGKHGSDLLRGALERLHATYIGYHGYADEWIKDNPELTVELLNRCGYWYFPHRAEFPDTMKRGAPNTITIAWENRGVAPAHKPFRIKIRLDGKDAIEAEQDASNQRWLPGETIKETYAFSVPSGAAPGEYDLKMKLICPETDRDVALALDKALMDEERYYQIGKVTVK